MSDYTIDDVRREMRSEEIKQIQKDANDYIESMHIHAFEKLYEEMPQDANYPYLTYKGLLGELYLTSDDECEFKINPNDFMLKTALFNKRVGFDSVVEDLKEAGLLELGEYLKETAERSGFKKEAPLDPKGYEEDASVGYSGFQETTELKSAIREAILSDLKNMVSVDLSFEQSQRITNALLNDKTQVLVNVSVTENGQVKNSVGLIVDNVPLHSINNIKTTLGLEGKLPHHVKAPDLNKQRQEVIDNINLFFDKTFSTNIQTSFGRNYITVSEKEKQKLELSEKGPSLLKIDLLPLDVNYTNLPLESINLNNYERFANRVDNLNREIKDKGYTGVDYSIMTSAIFERHVDVALTQDIELKSDKTLKI